MVINNWIKKVSDLDKSKVENAIDEFWVDKVNQTLTDKNIEWAKTAPVKAEVIEIPKIDTETTPEITTEWVKGFNENQVVVPWVNTTEVKPDVIETTPVETIEAKTDTAPVPTITEVAEVEAWKKANQDDQFNRLIESNANPEELRTFFNNAEFKDEAKANIKTFVAQQNLIQKTAQFSTLSDKELYNAIQKWQLAEWWDIYNGLPEELKASYQDFKTKQNNKNTVLPFRQQELDFTDILKNIKDVFSSSARNTFNELMTWGRMWTLVSEREDKALEIKGIDDDIEKILWDETSKQFAWLPTHLINAKKSKLAESLLNQKETLLAEYNATTNEISALKEDIDREVQFGQLEDANKKEAYMTALWLYETRRKEMRADEKAALLEQNKKLALDEQFTRNKELALFNQRISQENAIFTKGLTDTNAWGKYVDDWKGNLVYIKNWEQINVLEWLWKAVWTSTDNNYSYQIKQNEDGTYSVFGLPKKDWLNVTVNTFWADWKASWSYLNSFWEVTWHGWAYDRNRGLDLDWNVWDAIPMPFEWKVITMKNDRLFWKTVIVQWKDWNQIRFSHLDNFNVNFWDTIGKWQIVWTIGNTWNVLKLDWTKPSAEELKQWFWSHLDIVSIKPDWTHRSSYETESWLNWLGKEEIKRTVDTELAQWILDWTSKLSDFTPTDKRKIIPELNKLIDAELTDDADRNLIIKSAVKKKDLSETALQKIQDMETVKFQLNTLEETLAKVDTWPILWILNGSNPYNTNSQLALAQLAWLTPKVARGIFWEVWVLTDADIKNYQRALPNLKSTADKNALVLDFMRDLLGTGLKNTIITQAKGNRNMSNFLNDYDDLNKWVRVNKYLNSWTTAPTTSWFVLWTNATIKQNEFFSD